MHIQDSRMRRWLQERMEPRHNRPGFDRDKKLRMLQQLYYAETPAPSAGMRSRQVLPNS
jgi:2-oxoglutarate dehydrogenase E1 component